MKKRKKNQPKLRKIKIVIDGSSGPWFALFRMNNSFVEE